MLFVDNLLHIVAVLLLLMMIVVLYRAIIGPTMIDRIIAVNVVGTKTTTLLVIIGTIFGRVDMFVDLAITYALFNFIGSLAAARLLRHRHAQQVQMQEGTNA